LKENVHGDSRAAATESGTRTGHKIKTSAAAVFALVFGVCALVCALTVLLSRPRWCSASSR